MFSGKKIEIDKEMEVVFPKNIFLDIRKIWILPLVFAIYFISFKGTDLSITKIFKGSPYLLDFARRMFPPNIGYTPKIVTPMLETIEIAIIGTTGAVILGMIIGLFAAKNISPHSIVYWFARLMLNFCRAISELIFGLIFVAAVGLGPFAGVLAICIHAAGMLGKFFAEAVESADPGPVEALKATGANRIKTICYAIMPQVMPQFIAFSVYRFEVSVRAASVLGLVGAGGIGFELQMAMRLFNYEDLSLILCVLFISVILIDYLCTMIRMKIIT
jgi:phosphonate transport system permease protein